jgi:hypothetical protein
MKKRTKAFDGFDLGRFWKDSKYARQAYVDAPVTAAKVARVERALKVELPAAYVALMKTQNGGIPIRTNHRTREGTSWAEDHVAISGIFAIGDSSRYALCGEAGSRFWIDEWGYPAIGVYFASCPSAGHDMLCLDYRKCGPRGEPTVVHVDQENDYEITRVAPTFEAFIRGLEDDAAFEGEEEREPAPAPKLWRKEAVSVKVARGQVGMHVAPHLLLTRKLGRDETGWTMMKIELPGSWRVSRAAVKKGAVEIGLKTGGTYRVGPANVGALSFAILDGGDKSDGELAAIWEKHTRARAARPTR